MDIDDAIDDFISILDFDQILAWANLLDVEINYPPIDDMWPDWQNELAVEVGDAMRKVGEKKPNLCICCEEITEENAHLHRNCGK